MSYSSNNTQKKFSMKDNKSIVNCSKDEKSGIAAGDVAAAGAAVAGVGTCAAGTTAAVIGTATVTTTAGLSAAAVTGTGAAIGGAIGATAGGIAGASIGIATGGVGMAGTIPLAVAGGITGASLGSSAAATVVGALGIPIATTVTVVTTPVWAVPVAIAGGVVAIGSIAYLAYEKLKSK